MQAAFTDMFCDSAGTVMLDHLGTVQGWLEIIWALLLLRYPSWASYSWIMPLLRCTVACVTDNRCCKKTKKNSLASRFSLLNPWGPMARPCPCRQGMQRMEARLMDMECQG